MGFTVSSWASQLPLHGVKFGIGASPGNLRTHLAQFDEAGYIKTSKEFRGRCPVTWIEATELGRRACDRYLKIWRLLSQKNPR